MTRPANDWWSQNSNEDLVIENKNQSTTSIEYYEGITTYRQRRILTVSKNEIGGTYKHPIFIVLPSIILCFIID